jgi:hypothetical protein
MKRPTYLEPVLRWECPRCLKTFRDYMESHALCTGRLRAYRYREWEEKPQGEDFRDQDQNYSGLR